MFVVLTIVLVMVIALALPSPSRPEDQNDNGRYITIDNFMLLPRTPKPHGTLTEKQNEYLQLPR